MSTERRRRAARTGRVARRAAVVAVALSAGSTAQAQPAEIPDYDVVVYGGTAGGVAAAVAAAREGRGVALLVPGRHLGGMMSGGLGATDVGDRYTVGGISAEILDRLGWWFFEPHEAETVFNDLVRAAGVNVFLEHRLLEGTQAVLKTGAHIDGVRTESGRVFRGRVFIDATYEGDLMAWSGVSHTIGRESTATYGESLAGIAPGRIFDVDPYDENGDPLPGVHDEEPGPLGDGDANLPAYNFRLCLTNAAGNMIPMTPPVDYDPGRYELVARHLAAEPGLTLQDMAIWNPLSNGKFDVNSSPESVMSTDYVGASRTYPTASYAERERIRQHHEDHVAGFFHFLKTDERVPEPIRSEMAGYGLAADEFLDTGHWPHQMYVREARRMIGAYVMTEADCCTNKYKADAVGVGAYAIDSHDTQRVPTENGATRAEGRMFVRCGAYPIPYRALLPRREECDNLLVTVCVSASHVAYSTMRMEPVYMILGHSAGVAAADAARGAISVHDVDVDALRATLLAQGQFLGWSDDPNDLGWIVIDDDEAELTGEWRSRAQFNPFAGSGYLQDTSRGNPAKSARYTPALPVPGRYEVRLIYPYIESQNARNVPVIVRSAEGTDVVLVDQRRRPPGRAVALTIGTWEFAAGSAGSVVIGNSGADGVVNADAVQFKRAGDATGDHVVGLPDLLAVLAAWGPCRASPDCRMDLDADGTVGWFDALAVLYNWDG